MHKPLLSTYFLVRAVSELPDGTHQPCDEWMHRVCTREQVTDDAYLNVVAHSLYSELEHLHHKVVRTIVYYADLPGGERVQLNHAALPKDLEPRRSAA